MADVVLTINDNASGGNDLAQERRQQAMLDRLAMLHESRMQDSCNRRAASTSEPQESLDRFDRLFSEHRESVEGGLIAAREKKDLQGVAEYGAVVKENQLHKLMLEIGEMEQLVAASSYYLPAYSVRASQATIGRLRDETGVALLELVPRKKFSFSKRPIKDSSSDTSKPTASSKISSASHSDAPSVSDRSSVPGIRNLSNQVIVKNAEDLGDGEFVITDLSSCRVELRGSFRALFIHRVIGCQIFAGPVTGSVMIEDVDSSILMLASHQIRIHSTKATDFYLRVRSRPIVEYTRDVRFAPYAFQYTGIEEQLMACNMSEETGLWERVDDFRWLRSVQSPNWSILPQTQRLCIVDGINAAASASAEDVVDAADVNGKSVSRADVS